MVPRTIFTFSVNWVYCLYSAVFSVISLSPETWHHLRNEVCGTVRIVTSRTCHFGEIIPDNLKWSTVIALWSSHQKKHQSTNRCLCELCVSSLSYISIMNVDGHMDIHLENSTGWSRHRRAKLSSIISSINSVDYFSPENFCNRRYFDYVFPEWSKSLVRSQLSAVSERRSRRAELSRDWQVLFVWKSSFWHCISGMRLFSILTRRKSRFSRIFPTPSIPQGGTYATSTARVGLSWSRAMSIANIRLLSLLTFGLNLLSDLVHAR